MRHLDPLDYLIILKDGGIFLDSASAAAWAWFKTRHAHSWPSAQGTIMGTQVKSITNSYIRPWVGDLTDRRDFMVPRSEAPLLVVTLAVVIATIGHLLPPIPQPLAYHHFADHRPYLSIPNFEAVVSNIPFAIVGLCGLIFLLKPRAVA